MANKGKKIFFFFRENDLTTFGSLRRQRLKRGMLRSKERKKKRSPSFLLLYINQIDEE